MRSSRVRGPPAGLDLAARAAALRSLRVAVGSAGFSSEAGASAVASVEVTSSTVSVVSSDSAISSSGSGRCRAGARRSGRERRRAWRTAGPPCSRARRWRAAGAGRTAHAGPWRDARAGPCRRGREVRTPSSLTVLTQHELGLHGQLVAGQAHGLASEGLRHAGELEHHATRLDDGDPALRVALAGAHAGLGRLLGVGLVREDVDPHLAATLDLAGHGDTGGLDLPVGQPAGLQRLQAVVAERHGLLAAREAVPPPAVHLAELDALWGEHQRLPPAETLVRVVEGITG